MTFINSLCSWSSMVSANRTTTMGPSSTGRRSRFMASTSYTSKVSGVEILTTRPRKSDKAVEAAPTIWFITSHTALRVSSSSTNSSSGVSVPKRMSTMTLISLMRSSMILLPSRPETYLISTPTAGSISPSSKSFTSTTSTEGVVISTRWSNMLETAVAEDPRLIFMISPMASISIGLKTLLLIYYSVPSSGVMVHLFYLHGQLFIADPHQSVKPPLPAYIEVQGAVLLLV